LTIAFLLIRRRKRIRKNEKRMERVKRGEKMRKKEDERKGRRKVEEIEASLPAQFTFLAMPLLDTTGFD